MATIATRSDTKKLAASYNDSSIDRQLRFALIAMERMQIKEGTRILDGFCGTGLPTLELARRVGSNGEVFAFDISADCIEQARKNLRKENNELEKAGKPPLNITLFVASHKDFLDHLGDTRFNYIFVSSGFHWIPEKERPAFLQDTTKILKPDGRVDLSGGDGDGPHPSLSIQTAFSKPPFNLEEVPGEPSFLTLEEFKNLKMNSGYKNMTLHVYDDYLWYDDVQDFLEWDGQSSAGKSNYFEGIKPEQQGDAQKAISEEFLRGAVEEPNGRLRHPITMIISTFQIPKVTASGVE